MRYLEDWQLKLLQDMCGMAYQWEEKEDEAVRVPNNLLLPLLAEVRASRTPAVTTDPLREAVQKVGKDLDEQAHKRHCPECGSAKLEKGTFVFCFDCHEYRELP